MWPPDLSALPRVKVNLVPPPFVHAHEQVATGGPKVVEFKLTIEEKQLVIDDYGTTIQAMTFNGSVPGPLMVVHQAAQLMLEKGISGIPVLDDGGVLVGIVTEGDLIRRVEPESIEQASARWLHWAAPEGLARDFVRSHSWKVADVMTSPVVTVTQSTPLHDVADLLQTRGIKRLPVVQDGRLVGIISRADLLRCVVNEPPDSIAPGDDGILVCVRARLLDAKRLLSSQPTATVHQGVVRLEGILGSQAEQDAARVLIETIPGVVGVDNRTTLLVDRI